jgi:WD40 repeat protein
MATQGDCLFVKRYRSHKGPVTALEVSPSGDLCATMCRDGTVKIYDVASFDMIIMLRLSFVPGCCAFIADGIASSKKLAVAELNAPKIWLFDISSGNNDPLCCVEDVHQAPVTCMAVNSKHRTVCLISHCLMSVSAAIWCTLAPGFMERHVCHALPDTRDLLAATG